ncbi:PP2C family protein-serine/threonine phosphatase [Calycomorphotria hydatis]|uniref:Serine/threonine phosphatase stp n=1 Tax=Calycomorphotria hydatis TaxID=2528027 RepID=A0A517T7P0_9PLAN|nr:protein phosphatase 2C domain-containing protein [Calycomorphotria hydatis]QDT64392.1 Serine/threonine phosphatase stp [Calycomorphotria hydatis]
MFSLRSGLVSIPGRFRENNEDSGLVDDQARYFLVADGMGGQAAGERASAMAVELVSRELEQRLTFESEEKEKVLSSIDHAVDYANSEIIALGQVEPDFHQMGTTIVLMVRVGNALFAGGVGDSRIYRLHNDELKQVTTDHSLTQALIDAGTISPAEAEHHRYRNVLYRYLGTKDGSKGTEAQLFEPHVGDRFLLCSDGVTEGVSDEDLQRLLAAGDDPQPLAEAIVAAAEEGGSRDNITCLVIFVEEATE